MTLRTGDDRRNTDKSAKTGDLQLVENFVGNVIGVFCEVGEDLHYCGVFESISPLSRLFSFIYTRERYIAAKRHIRSPWFL